MKMTCIPSGTMGVNTYVVGDESTGKAFIVDPGGFNKETVNWLNDNGFKLEYIILTHGHGDHIGGVKKYMEMFPGVKLVAGEHEKELLASPMMNASREICGESIMLTADIWVHEGDTLKVGDIELRFMHTPGHTPGSVCYQHEKTLFCGDTLFYQGYGRVDLAGGNSLQMALSLKRLLKLPGDVICYPGHGMKTKIAWEREANA